MNDKVEGSTDWMNIDEVAAYTRFKKNTIYKFTSTRIIPFHKIGLALRFHKKSIDEWMNSERVLTTSEYKDGLAAKVSGGGAK